MLWFCLVGGLVVDQRLANGRVSHMRAFGGMVRVEGRFCFGMVMGFCGALLGLCGEKGEKEKFVSYGGFTWVANGTVSKGRASGCCGLPGGRVGREPEACVGCERHGFKGEGFWMLWFAWWEGWSWTRGLRTAGWAHMRAFGGMVSGGWGVLF